MNNNSIASFWEYNNNLHEGVKWTRSLFDHLFTLPYSEINDFFLKKAVFAALKGDNPNADKMYYLIPDDDFRYQLPLVPAMIERVVGSVVTYGIHASSPENLEKLMKLQGKKSKQVSAYTTDEEGRMTSGVHGGGGVYSILKGNVYAGGSTDIMSIVDKQGRRLVDLGPKSELAYAYDYEDLVKSSEYKKMVTDLLKFRRELTNKLVPLGRKSIEYDAKTGEIDEKKYVERAIDTSSPLVKGTIKRDFIKKYIDGSEKILMKHKDVFAKMYIGWARKQSKSWNSVADSYDELVMGNFEIVAVYLEDYIEEDFIMYFSGDPDDAFFTIDDYELPSLEEVIRRNNFKFPVKIATNTHQLLPKIIDKLK